MADKQIITVGVEGGVVQWIQGIPRGIRVVVHDYDVDGADKEELSKDENGDEYLESVWDDTSPGDA